MNSSFLCIVMQVMRNIIFDFGGVIINIDPLAVAGELGRMGMAPEDGGITGLHEHLLEQNAYMRFETGKMSPLEFREAIREYVKKPLTDRQIDAAWNAIIRDIPPDRIRLLENLRKDHRIFLLSNTNPIHFDFYNDYIRITYGYPSVAALFERAYYSFQLGLYKPDPGIFQLVLRDSELVPGDTLYIDDSSANCDIARKTGMKAIHLAGGMEVTELFASGGIDPVFLKGQE